MPDSVCDILIIDSDKYRKEDQAKSRLKGLSGISKHGDAGKGLTPRQL